MRALLRLFIFGVSLAALARAAEPERTVATVNGVGITAREFVEAQQRLRFRFEHNAAGLRAAALADCVDFQVRLQLARAQGTLADTSDAAVRAAFTAENARRAKAKAAGEPVYGPLQLTWPQFRRYWLDQIERVTKAAIDRAAGAETDAELKKFYADHPALFTPPGAKQPQPFAELADHVLNQYREARYARLVREAVTAARVERDEPALAALGPNTPTPATDAR